MNKLTPFLNTSLTVTTSLYSVALATSMAGMEFFGWLSALLLLALGIKDYFAERQLRWTLPGLEVPLVGFALISALGAFLVTSIDSDERLFILGSLRWIVLCFALYVVVLNKLISPKRFISTLFFTGLAMCT